MFLKNFRFCIIILALVSYSRAANTTQRVSCSLRIFAASARRVLEFFNECVSSLQTFPAAIFDDLAGTCLDFLI